MQLILENLTGNLLTCPLLGNLTLHHPPPNPPPPPQKKKKKKQQQMKFFPLEARQLTLSLNCEQQDFGQNVFLNIPLPTHPPPPKIMFYNLDVFV